MKPARHARSSLPVLIASGLGCGWFPRAPGTAASLAALVPGILLGLVPGLLPVAILSACAGGLWAIPRASGGADHGWVVIDEVAGLWITLLGVPRLTGVARPTGITGWPKRLLWPLAAFAVFRLLDITKPGPIATLDRRHDAFGVMADDVLAGIVGAVLLRLVRLLLSDRR